MKTIIILLVMLVVLISTADAHVALVYPLGGESFDAGQPVTVKWHVTIPHDLENWDIYYSADGGENWNVVAMNLPDSQFEYKWKVPENMTVSGRVKVVMDNKTASDYESVSNNFAIHLVTSTFNNIQEAPKLASLSIYPNPLRALNHFSFNLTEKGHIVIEVFSLAGSKIMTILNEQLLPGRYTGNWDASGLTGGSYLIVLRADNYRTARLLIKESEQSTKNED